ncbi:MAG TPA: multicopper oxidase domain-containing protein [Ktedonobacteraceae bacterium]|nr:multicopper oxidase domain-containing protein [Ktedonobacteraceae bacterium]
MTDRRQFLKISAVVGAGALTLTDEALSVIPHAFASQQVPQTPFPGANISQFVEPLPTFVGSRVKSDCITVSIREFQQKILPAQFYTSLSAPFSAGTYVWGYKVDGRPVSSPGFTIEAIQGKPTYVTYINHLPRPMSSKVEPLLTVDQTLFWANPLKQEPSAALYKGPVPISPHWHGGEVPSQFDGGPMAWFTQNGIHGSAYNTLEPTSSNAAIYRYPNAQPPTTLWFHDHAMGITRLNVFAGLFAFYLLRDRYDTGLPGNPLNLPTGHQEVEIAIADRQFDTNGQILFPDGSPAADPTGLNGPPPNPSIHPYWIPEFFGDTIMVNGKTWPFLEVEPRRYRFRLLDGSNARFYEMRLVDLSNNDPGPPFWQIGTDGGLLDRPVELNNPQDPNALPLLLAPGERADIIIDFAGLEGRTFTLVNTAAAPYPDGNILDPATTGRIMQFRVTLPLSHPDTTYDPKSGKPLRSQAVDLHHEHGQHPDHDQHHKPEKHPDHDQHLHKHPDHAKPPHHEKHHKKHHEKHHEKHHHPYPPYPRPIVRLVNPANGTLAPGVKLSQRRQLVLIEVSGPGGPIEILLNNTLFTGVHAGTDIPIPGSRFSQEQGAFMTELPEVGSTEEWEIINLTADAHPIHLHLVQFQLLNRQDFDVTNYSFTYDAAFPAAVSSARFPNDLHWSKYPAPANASPATPGGVFLPGYGPPLLYNSPNTSGAIGGNPDVTPFLTGQIVPPDPNEAGWKDTVKMYPNQVTRIVVRWAPLTVPVKRVRAGENLYPFDPTCGPGYVWHCHILDHEDNEMMRPYIPVQHKKS